MPDSAKRPYSSPLRAESARRTRVLVRDAAARLFAEHGYVSTTVRNVAVAAGVSARTVFTAFPGGKAELFHEALHAAIQGDTDAAPAARTPRDGDPVERILERMVEYSTDVLERAGTLMATSIESSGADADMRRFADEGARASAENAMTLAEGLAAHELLPRDLRPAGRRRAVHGRVAAGVFDAAPAVRVGRRRLPELGEGDDPRQSAALRDDIPATATG